MHLGLLLITGTFTARTCCWGTATDTGDATATGTGQPVSRSGMLESLQYHVQTQTHRQSASLMQLAVRVGIPSLQSCCSRHHLCLWGVEMYLNLMQALSEVGWDKQGAHWHGFYWPSCRSGWHKQRFVQWVVACQRTACADVHADLW
jgi:hypothetical protein